MRTRALTPEEKYIAWRLEENKPLKDLMDAAMELNMWEVRALAEILRFIKWMNENSGAEFETVYDITPRVYAALKRFASVQSGLSVYINAFMDHIEKGQIANYDR